MSVIYTPETLDTRANKINATKEAINRVDASILQRKQEREKREATVKKCNITFNWTIGITICAFILAFIGVVVYVEYYNYYEDLCDKDATQCHWGTIHCNIKECCIRIEAYKTPDQIIRLNQPCDNLQAFKQ